MKRDIYTFENIIINPNLEEVRLAIGKRVYAGNYPVTMLNNAQYGIGEGTLLRVNPNSCEPFIVKLSEVRECAYTSIIISKEKKNILMPFISVEDFLDTYQEVVSKIEENPKFKELLNKGMLLKSNYSDNTYTIRQVHKEGVTMTAGKFYPWSKLMDSYCFLDGSPCGKIMKETVN